jgi:hypothetical protein
MLHLQALVAQVSRFRLPPPPPEPSIAAKMDMFYHNAAPQTVAVRGEQSVAGDASGKESSSVALSGKETASGAVSGKESSTGAASGHSDQVSSRAEAAKAASKNDAERARLYRRLWQEQGTDYSAIQPGDKVNPSSSSSLQLHACN